MVVNRKGYGIVMMVLLAGAPYKARTFVLLDLYLYLYMVGIIVDEHIYEVGGEGGRAQSCKMSIILH